MTLPAVSTPGQPRWAFAVGPWTALPEWQLTAATQRSCKLRLTGTSEVTLTVDGTAPEAQQFEELVTDLWVMRDGFTLFRGRVGPSTDDLDGTKNTVSLTVGDYRALLQRRQIWDSDPLTWTSWYTSDIGGNLLAATQGQPGGNLQIIDSHLEVGPLRTVTYPAGQSVGAAIEQLSLMDTGFNWDIVPTTGQVTQTYTTWESRGENKGRVLSYPGSLSTVRRSVDPSGYANAIRETGNTDIAAVRVEASDIAITPEGRWDRQVGDTTLLDAASVVSRAAYDLAASQVVSPAYTVKLRPGEWGGPVDIWLGDVVLLSINSGRLQVNGEPLRVWEIDLDLDDADNETVTLTLAALDPFKRARARQYDQRLSALERR